MSQITASLSSGTVVELTNGRHSWRADEPLKMNGTDTGPNPYELLLSSLAACTCITLAFYCRHKNLPFESVSSSFELTRSHAEDCADCDDPAKGFVERIVSRINISGDFDEAQRRRLAEISERCPVHRTLANGVAFSDNVTFS